MEGCFRLKRVRVEVGTLQTALRVTRELGKAVEERPHEGRRHEGSAYRTKLLFLLRCKAVQCSVGEY